MPKSRNRKKRKGNRNVQVADEIIVKDTKFGKVRTRSGDKVTINHGTNAAHVDQIKGEWERKAWLAWKALPKEFRKTEVRSTWIAAWLRTFKPQPYGQNTTNDGGTDQTGRNAEGEAGAGGQNLSSEGQDGDHAHQ